MPEPRPSRSSFQTYLFIALVAVELLMSFTFLGYLHVQPISITFAYIPPILAGCLLGPVQATVLGAVFGLASLFKASSSYVMPMDQLFSPFRSGAPMASLILSVGTRTLFALLIGLALLWCRKRRHRQHGDQDHGDVRAGQLFFDGHGQTSFDDINHGHYNTSGPTGLNKT